MLSKALVGGLLALVAVLSSCFSWPDPAFEWVEDEHHWRIDGERDVVEWIEITHGLCNPSADFDERMQGLLAGSRETPPGGHMTIGFGNASVEHVGDLPEWAEPYLARTVTHEVVEARFVLDEQGRPTLWRRMRFLNASTILVQQQVGTASMRPDAPVEFDEHDVTPLGCRMWLVHSDRQIWRLEGNAFVGEIPIDIASAAQWLELARRDPVEPGLRPPADVTFDGATLRIRWTPDATGWIGARTYDFGWGSTVEERTPLQTKLPIEPTSTYLQLRREAGLAVES